MPWYKTKEEEDKLPESLRNKTPEQIAQELKDAQDLKTKLAAAEAKVTETGTAQAALQSEFDKVKTQLAAIQAGGSKKEDEEEVNWFENPDAALNKKIAPLAQMTAVGLAQTARMLAQQQLTNQDITNRTIDGRLFQAWSSEIDVESKKYPVANLTTPQAWLGIYMFLKGTHADELANPEVRKQKYNFLEPAVTGGTPPVNTTHDDKLSDEELRIASQMGVTPEAYTKRKKAMKFATA